MEVSNELSEQEMEEKLTKYLNPRGYQYTKINDKVTLQRVYNLFLYNRQTDLNVTENTNNEDILYLYWGMYHFLNSNYDTMKNYYLMAIEKKNAMAMTYLASYFDSARDYDNAIKYYLMAVEKENILAMRNLANLYRRQKKYKSMKKYYKMAIEKGDDLNSMENLADYYKSRYNNKNMEKYFLMAIKKKSRRALEELSWYYLGKSDIKKFIKECSHESVGKQILNIHLNNNKNTSMFAMSLKYLSKDNLKLINRRIIMYHKLNQVMSKLGYRPHRNTIDCNICCENYICAIYKCKCHRNISNVCLKCYCKLRKCPYCRHPF